MDFNLINALTNDIDIDLITSNDDNIDDDEELLAELLAITSNDNTNVLVKKEPVSIESKQPSVSEVPIQTLPVCLPQTVSSKYSSPILYIGSNIDNVAGETSSNLFSHNQQAEIIQDNIITSQAETILKRRRKKYYQNVILAKQAGDRKNAIEWLNIVKQFDIALETVAAGAVLLEEDINQIPLSPLLYQPISKATNLMDELELRLSIYRQLIEKFNSENQGSKARMNERIANLYINSIKKLNKQQTVDVLSLPIPPGFEPLNLDLIAKWENQKKNVSLTLRNKSNTVISHQKIDSFVNHKKLTEDKKQSQTTSKSLNLTNNDQLKFVLMRQIFFKKASLEAKSLGDINTAVDLLGKAKLLNKMIDAAECGLPINIKDIPVPSLPLIEKIKNLNGNRSKLYHELKDQLKNADECRYQFQKLGDVHSTLFYEILLEKSINDLQRLSKSNENETPEYRVVEKQFPIADRNLEIPENELQLQIKKIEKLKLPDLNWKASDCQIYVTFNFPFPHDDHQIGRTSTVKGTKEPEFSEIFNLKINRQLKSKLIRIIKRIPLKLEIFQKGSFLRSDKLLAHIDIPLVDLENHSFVDKKFDILEGRRRTGGLIHVNIKISKPIGNETKCNAKISKKIIELL